MFKDWDEIKEAGNNDFLNIVILIRNSKLNSKYKDLVINKALFPNSFSNSGFDSQLYFSYFPRKLAILFCNQLIWKLIHLFKTKFKRLCDHNIKVFSWNRSVLQSPVFWFSSQVFLVYQRNWRIKLLFAQNEQDRLVCVLSLSFYTGKIVYWHLRT